MSHVCDCPYPRTYETICSYDGEPLDVCDYCDGVPDLDGEGWNRNSSLINHPDERSTDE